MHLKMRQCKAEICKIKKCLLEKVNVGDEYYRFGVDYFGPFLYGFICWFCNEINEKQYEKVFFFSRDGYMMQKAFAIFNSDKKIDARYVYFSRRSIRQALLHTCSSYEESLKYLTWERYITVGELLEYYGLSTSERKDVAQEESLELCENLAFSTLKENRRMKALYNSIQSLINNNSKYQDAMLKQYLNQIGMNGRCAMVDIGWHGNMQFYLEEFFEHIGRDVNLCGYYVGISPVPLLKSKSYGWLYQKEDLSLRKDVLCFLGGYEKLFQSCEGSTCGYVKQGGAIMPALAEYEYAEDKRMTECIKEWQEGAMDFVQEAYGKGATLDDGRAWAYPLIKFGKAPTNEDVSLLSSFYNTDGSKTYYISQKPLYKYKPREFIYALSGSPWKTGFLKSAFKLPLPYFQLYRLLRK